jgi:hypothetical protein
VWALDSNGNFLSTPVGIVTGTNTSLESIETLFGQDLNADGTIGPPPPPPPVLIQTDGPTSLVEVGNNFDLYNTSTQTGPSIKVGGVAVTAGEFGTYTPIGAVQVAGGGYDVAWHDPSSGLYTVWALDSNGNYLSSPVGVVPGNNAALESIETTFGQDLNGDGTIGVPASGVTVTTNLRSAANSLADNFHFAGDGDGGSTGQTPQGTQNSAVTNEGHDPFVFVPNHGPAGTANFIQQTDLMPFNSTAFTDTHAAPTATHEDTFRGSPIHDTTQAAHWLAHHSDFHFV